MSLIDDYFPLNESDQHPQVLRNQDHQKYLVQFLEIYNSIQFGFPLRFSTKKTYQNREPKKKS